MEVGIEAAEITVRTAIKEEGFIDGIQSVEREFRNKPPRRGSNEWRGQLEAHPTYHDWKNMLFSVEVHFGWSDEG
jgi:hypothetical protein